MPLSVETEMAKRRSGRSASSVSTKVRKTCTSPTLTACSQTTARVVTGEFALSREPIVLVSVFALGNFLAPNSLSDHPRRYLPCFQLRQTIQGLTITNKSKYNPLHQNDIKKSRPCFPFAWLVRSGHVRNRPTYVNLY